MSREVKQLPAFGPHQAMFPKFSFKNVGILALCWSYRHRKNLHSLVIGEVLHSFMAFQFTSNDINHEKVWKAF